MKKPCWDLAMDTGIDLLLWLLSTELLLHGGDILLLRYPCEQDCAAISIVQMGTKAEEMARFLTALVYGIKGFVETQLKYA